MFNSCHRQQWSRSSSTVAFCVLVFKLWTSFISGFIYWASFKSLSFYKFHILLWPNLLNKSGFYTALFPYFEGTAVYPVFSRTILKISNKSGNSSDILQDLNLKQNRLRCSITSQKPKILWSHEASHWFRKSRHKRCIAEANHTINFLQTVYRYISSQSKPGRTIDCLIGFVL